MVGVPGQGLEMVEAWAWLAQEKAAETAEGWAQVVEGRCTTCH